MLVASAVRSRRAPATAGRPAGSWRGCSARARRSRARRLRAARRRPRVTSARRYGRVAEHPVEPDAREARTISRRLPSGSLNILWMCVERADRVQVGLAGSSWVGSRCVKTPMTLPPAMASSIELDGRLAGHGQRHERVGKQHGVAQRQHRHFGRHGVRAFAAPGWTRGGLVAHDDPPFIGVASSIGRPASRRRLRSPTAAPR